MAEQTRVTIALDKETSGLLRSLQEETKSKSGLFRQALQFYSEYKELVEECQAEKIKAWADMLSKGEHVVLGLDYWILFLKFIEESANKNEFWESCRVMGASSVSRLSPGVHSAEDFLKKLEACNFYRLSKIAEDEYVLILNSDVCKGFVKNFIQDALNEIGYEVEIDESISKLRVAVRHKKQGANR